MDQGVFGTQSETYANAAIFTNGNPLFSDALKSCKYVIEHLICAIIIIQLNVRTPLGSQSHLTADPSSNQVWNCLWQIGFAWLFFCLVLVQMHSELSNGNTNIQIWLNGASGWVVMSSHVCPSSQCCWSLTSDYWSSQPLGPSRWLPLTINDLLTMVVHVSFFGRLW